MVARMTSRFPNTVTRYMDRKSSERTDWNSVSSEGPWRRNTGITVWVSGSM